MPRVGIVSSPSHFFLRKNLRSSDLKMQTSFLTAFGDGSLDAIETLQAGKNTFQWANGSVNDIVRSDIPLSSKFVTLSINKHFESRVKIDSECVLPMALVGYWCCVSSNARVCVIADVCSLPKIHAQAMDGEGF